MTPAAQQELNRLEDTDTSPAPSPRRRTLGESIAYAEANGYKWFVRADGEWRKLNGEWVKTSTHPVEWCGICEKDQPHENRRCMICGPD